MNNLRSMRTSISSKWNQKLLSNLDSSAYQTNNVGASFLTSPSNYTQQFPVVEMMQMTKGKLIADLEKFKPKRISNLTHQLPPSRSSFKRMLSPQEKKLDELAKTFTENMPGKIKNGRVMLETEFQRLTVTQITSPVGRSPRNSGSSLNPFSKTALSTKYQSSSIRSPAAAHKTIDNAWKTTMSP